MKRIALIPARGGSKRIPKKNIRLFCGKPIIAYSIAAAQNTGLFDRVIVSTDSSEIAAIAVAYGAEVPFLRPAHLASDTATTSAVLSHALDWLSGNGGCDELCLLYPTCPLLQPEDIRKGVDLLRAGHRAVVSVQKFPYPIQRALRLYGENNRVDMVEPHFENIRSQDLENYYHDAGQFYWFKAKDAVSDKEAIARNPAAIVLSQGHAQDIDTEEDWRLAEAKFRYFGSEEPRPAATTPEESLIALGTAQIGLESYGLFNRVGAPNPLMTADLLFRAWAGGIRYFDTAQSYGKSEAILGQYISGKRGLSRARCMTKLAPTVDIFNERAIRLAIESSLSKLRVSKLWCVYLHTEEHLDHWGGNLGATLTAMRREGLIENLGASVYTPKAAVAAISIPDISILQIPANVFDRRMYRAQIGEKVLDSKKEVFVRSIFLQGIAAANWQEVPNSIPDARRGVKALTDFCDAHGVQRREFCFAYVRHRFPGARLLIGAETPEQVDENFELENRMTVDSDLYDKWDAVWPDDKISLIDPRGWRVSKGRQFVRLTEAVWRKVSHL